MSNTQPVRLGGNLTDSEVLALCVDQAYEGFTAVPNATADLKSYDLLSVLKRRKRKQKSAASNSWTSKFSEAASALVGRNSANKENDDPSRELEATEIFQQPPAKIPNIEDAGKPKYKIGEFRNRSLFGQQSSEWSAGYSPPPTPVLNDSLSFKWTQNRNPVLVDLGEIYESKLRRASVKQWLESSQEHIDHKDLRQVSKDHDLFVINHVLYSEKFRFHQGSHSDEKAMKAGSASASSTTHETHGCSPVTVRPKHIGAKPFAYKFVPLKVKKGKKKKPWTLALGPEPSRHASPLDLCRQFSASETPSQETQASSLSGTETYFVRVFIFSGHGLLELGM